MWVRSSLTILLSCNCRLKLYTHFVTHVLVILILALNSDGICTCFVLTGCLAFYTPCCTFRFESTCILLVIVSFLIYYKVFGEMTVPRLAFSYERRVALQWVCVIYSLLYVICQMICRIQMLTLDILGRTCKHYGA